MPVQAANFRNPTPATIAGSRLSCVLIYSELGVTINPGVGGSTGVHVFSLNGLFDPNITGVGHQCAGFDQLMAIYEQYVVKSCKYRITIASSDTGSANLHGVTVTDELGTKTDPRVYIENGNTQWNYVTGKTESGPSVSVFSGEVRPCDVHGQTMKEYLSDDTYRGDSSNNPAEMAYIHIWAADPAGGDTGSQLVTVELVFDCDFFGGKLNALS